MGKLRPEEDGGGRMILRLARQGAPWELQMGRGLCTFPGCTLPGGGGGDGKHNIRSPDLRSSVWFNFYGGLTMHKVTETALNGSH